MLVLLWFAMLTLGAGPLDETLHQMLYAGGRPLLVAVAKAFTILGQPAVLIPVGFAVAAWLWWARGWRHAVAVLAVTLVGRGLVEAQKYAIERLRPSDEIHLIPVSTPSFPSGHAASSMIVCLTIALVVFSRTRWKWPAIAVALILSLCIGTSRVLLGVHWPSDVIGGWAFGLLWVVIALPWAERLAERP